MTISADRARLWALAAVGAVVAASFALTWGGGASYLPAAGSFAFDYDTYHIAAARWLAGGGFYEAKQLAGPYVFETFREPTYPPTTIPLFAAFVFLPAVLWWTPALIVAWSIRKHRPSPLALVLIAIALVSRLSIYAWNSGNPSIWVAGAVALATHRGWAAPLVLLKPTWAPLAFIGIRDPRWWWTLAMGIGVALLFTPMWSDWLTVIRNAQSGFGYSVMADIPVIAVPVLAWLGATAARPPSAEAMPGPSDGASKPAAGSDRR